MTDIDNTEKEFSDALAMCRRVFVAKLGDYGPSWRIMRPEAITDQLFIKAKRIRTLQIKGTSAVGEGILPEFVAIVNYGIIGVIQLRRGFSDHKDMSAAEAVELYDSVAAEAKALMVRKNTDYDEAWRGMRVLSYVDLILTKIERTKEIEDHEGLTKVSEGIDANYFDMVNYAVFGIIKLTDADAGRDEA
ncbi:MAG: DUF1599 domain-containing protein [Muribaculaceae bacterium]|nr:DUF1599 domain-containing protein [Muribaculaceae bacterium]